MYIETSSPRRPGDNAKISRMVTLSGKSCLKFYYHMYGGHMGKLNVKLCDQVIFNKSGNQGNQWRMYQVRLLGTGSKEVHARMALNSQLAQDSGSLKLPKWGLLPSLEDVMRFRRRSVALWLGRWTCNLETPGSNPPPCH